MTLATDRLDQLAVDTIRTLSIDGVQQANSGHPGAPMGAAPMAYAAVDPPSPPLAANPGWPNRDRFVLSAGHASMLLYSMLHLTGLRRQPRRPQVRSASGARSRPGHPEYGLTLGGRGDDRPARPGPRQRHRHGHRGAAARRGVQPARARHRRPPDLRHRQRRRHAGRASRPRPARWPATCELGKLSCCTTTTGSSSTGRRRGRSARTCSPASRPTAGTPSGSRTATTSPRSRPPSMPPRPTTGRRSSPSAPTSASAARTSRTPRRRTGRRSGPDEVKLVKEAYGWDPDRTFYVPDDAGRGVPSRDRRRQGPGRRVPVAARPLRGGVPGRGGGAGTAPARGPAARRLGRRPAVVRGRHRGRDAQREPGHDPGAGGRRCPSCSAARRTSRSRT